MADKQNISDDEVAVRDLIEAWADSVRRRDYDGILRSHAADFVMFDVPPPFKSVGLTPTGKPGTCSFPGRVVRFALRFKRWTLPPVPMSPSHLRLCAARDRGPTASLSRSIFV